ncbi:tRNA (adenine(58)-N(1))-methyltransferase non-catalytic subunit TRM6-like [Oppia nitens]|uniref:tRNA (adenine(58)-N(1))-methyltransferase non-catalytic subunit TRM6-like n=1 Tax=Oppia nitens TaxID=1686743 RepID=UPI0023DC3ABC|nr:tRNA (adenine(58)-N(1))-methyltransferase non-catalytic subunit TRM6-like [Oppia nitens]
MDDNCNVICVGNYVIIRRTYEKESCRLFKAEMDKPVYLGKQKIFLNSIFGQKFGSTFEVNKDRHLELVNVQKLREKSAVLPLVSSETDDKKDNRFVLDDGKSQKLSRDDIEVLKSNASSDQIIENLVKNCSTFEQKTSFAQQKYLKKKQKKYSNLMTILRPNVRLLTEMYFSRGPQKIDFLRIDSLSQMLSICNVMSGRKYIVLDTNLGILTAAIIERLGCTGSVVQIYTEVGPVSTYRQAVDALNLPNDIINNMLFGLQINEIYNLSQNLNYEISCSTDVSNNILSETTKMSSESDISVSENNRNMRRAVRRIEAQKAIEILRPKDMDGLLYLSKTYDPLNILLILIDLLSDSRPFAVFSAYVEPLAHCYSALKKKAVFLKITETWLRNYQVLPDRTRPHMTMSANSGYLLTGIKVDNNS